MAKALSDRMKFYTGELLVLLERVIAEKQNEADTIKTNLRKAPEFPKSESLQIRLDEKASIEEEIRDAENSAAEKNFFREQKARQDVLKEGYAAMNAEAEQLLKGYTKDLDFLKQQRKKLLDTREPVEVFKIAFLVSSLTDSDIYERMVREFPQFTTAQRRDPKTQRRLQHCEELAARFQDLQKRFQECQVARARDAKLKTQYNPEVKRIRVEAKNAVGAAKAQVERLQQALAAAESKNEESRQVLKALSKQHDNLIETCSSMHSDTASSSQTLRSQISALKHDLEKTQRECEASIEALTGKSPASLKKRELQRKLLQCRARHKTTVRYMDLYGTLKERCESGMQDLTGFFISKMGEKLRSDDIPEDWKKYIISVARYAGDSLKHEAKLRFDALHDPEMKNPK